MPAHAGTSTLHRWRPSAGALIAIPAGIIGCVLAGVLAAASLKVLVVLVAGLGLAALAFFTGSPKAVFLGAWAFCLTYNRQYYVLDALFGSHGAQGPYLILADGFLVVLALLWMHDLVMRRALAPQGPALWLWFLPFVAASAVSAVLAQHPEWSLFEMFRLARIVFILLFFRYNAGVREWWAAVAGLLLAATAQAVLGTAEVLTGRSGLGGILGLSRLEEAAPTELRQESFYGWRRATATMSHPPNLACYLLMTIPVALAIGFSAQRNWIRIAGLLGGAAGLAGLACTLSRWPWAVMAAQLGMLLTGLVVLRLLSLQRALAVIVLSLCALMIPAAAFSEQIADRMTRDLNRSIDFRVQENATGWRIARENPVFGVGPNNYREPLLKYSPEWEWAMRYEEISIRTLHIRPIAAPHNGFLLILAETGAVGLAAFVGFFVAVLLLACDRIRRTTGIVRAACFGLLIGLVGLASQQLIDFSIWADPLLYTFALTVGLLGIAPGGTAQPEYRA